LYTQEFDLMETESESKQNESWYCYILRNRQPQYSHLTYNGSTNNPRRRLRQHNEEISGGARYTHGRNGGWEIYALLTGFVDHKNALSCEWRIKHTNGKPGKRPTPHLGMAGRIRGLNEVLKLDKWTGKCEVSNADVPYTLYLAEDVLHLVHPEELPSNITIIPGIPAEFNPCISSETSPGS
jgi:predicted GIY-YIG superfamily endonuclease